MRNVSDKIYRDAEDPVPSKREELTHDPEDIHPQTSAGTSNLARYFSFLLINPLNAELNPICCLLALLGAHHFLHVSRIRVNRVVWSVSQVFEIQYTSVPEVWADAEYQYVYIYVP
jgi:hypothetical protein